MIQSFNVNIGISEIKVNVHPYVIMNILELYYKSYPNQMAGTLLGIIYPSHIQITNVFAVPMLENKVLQFLQVQNLSMQYHKNTFELNKKVFSKQEMVGSFITTQLNKNQKCLNILTTLYGNKQNYFNPQGILNTPIILTLDPLMNNNDFDIQVSFFKQAHAYNVNYKFYKDFWLTGFNKLDLSIKFSQQKLPEVSPFITHQTNFQYMDISNFNNLLQKTLSNLKIIQKQYQSLKVIYLLQEHQKLQYITDQQCLKAYFFVQKAQSIECSFQIQKIDEPDPVIVNNFESKQYPFSFQDPYELINKIYSFHL